MKYTTRARAALYGAGVTILALVGGLALGFLVGSFVFDTLSGHIFANPRPEYMLAGAMPAFAGFIGGSALWGVLIGGLAGASDKKRLAAAGALGFAPITMVAILALQMLEPLAVDNLGAQLPIHRLFTFFFIPTAFLIAGVSAFAIGIGLRDRALAWALFWRVGIAAAFGFFIVNLFMQANGWIVGAPNAGERATMLTVMMAGNVGAAIVGGAVMGLTLSNAPVPVPHAARPEAA